MQLELNRSQAFMALGISIVSADGSCTSPETEMLFKLFKTFKLIPCNSEQECELEWERIFNETFAKLQRAFPNREISMTDVDLDRLIRIIEGSVEKESHESLFHFAVALAVSDGLDARETKILDRLCQDFNIPFTGDYRALLAQYNWVN